MAQAYFRFFAELNDFLPPSRRQVGFVHPVAGRPAVKDLIEALGVPHTEVDLITVDGRSVDFSYRVRDGDRICVYPVFEAIDVTPLVRVRPRPLRQTRFAVDAHLGRLAAYLRLLGFDALYRNDWDDDELARLAGRERRILLTRDRGLLKRSVVTHGYWVRSTKPRRQVAEVLRRLDLRRSVTPFTRCLGCNDRLRPVAKEEILHRLLPRTRQYYDEFLLCPGCDRIFWKGSHYQRMRRIVDALLEEESRGDPPGATPPQ